MLSIVVPSGTEPNCGRSGRTDVHLTGDGTIQTGELITIINGSCSPKLMQIMW